MEYRIGVETEGVRRWRAREGGKEGVELSSEARLDELRLVT